MPFFAEIGPDNVVQRVIVAETVTWCVETLGGWWVETFQHLPSERFASRGDVYQPEAAEKFLKPSEVNP